MITAIVNGQIQELESNTQISQLLAQQNLLGKRIAVEMNGQIIPKSQHPHTIVPEGATLEVVVAVGGG